MKTNRIITSVLGAGLLFGAATVQAFEHWTCLWSPITWASDNPRFRASAVSFPEGNSFTTALEDAVDAINDNPSNVSINLTTGDSSVALYNLQNEVWFSLDDFWLGEDVRGVCVSYSYCANWAEADVMFNADEDDLDNDFTTSTSKINLAAYGGSRHPFRNTAIHEFIHGLGLKHESDTYNIMGDTSNHLGCNGSTVFSYPGEDVVNGLVDLYGLDNTRRQDVAVVHWKRAGSWDGRSTHKRNVIRDSGGATLSIRSGTSNDPEYVVDNGQTIKFEVTIENNGHSSQSPQLGIYLSSNSLVTTLDTLLATKNPTINRNTVYENMYTVTLPSTLVSGQTYYLGAIVDNDDSISEVNESNNATYTAIRVR